MIRSNYAVKTAVVVFGLLFLVGTGCGGKDKSAQVQAAMLKMERDAEIQRNLASKQNTDAKIALCRSKGTLAEIQACLDGASPSP